MTVPADASAQLHRIAARLREAGEGGLRRDMTRTLRAQALPLKHAVQQAALDTLPHGGGLAQREADSVQIQVLTGARSASVRLRNRRLGAVQTDRYGYVRHPTIGTVARPRNEWDWTREDIPRARGWWSLTLARRSAAVGPAMVVTMQRIAARIQRG